MTLRLYQIRVVSTFNDTRRKRFGDIETHREESQERVEDRSYATTAKKRLGSPEARRSKESIPAFGGSKALLAP